MSRYSRTVEKELGRLADRAAKRSDENVLNLVLEAIQGWKNGRRPAADALREIRKLTIARQNLWSEDADPGVPIAQALADGTLSRDDLSDAAWEAINYLVTLAEI